jgi:general secretion pathway protein H
LKQRSQGFSLIEVMIVVVIIALLMGGVGLSIGATDRVKLRSSSWILMAAVRFAYSRAVTQGSTTRVVLDFEKKTIHVEETKGRVVLNRSDETGEGLKRDLEDYGLGLYGGDDGEPKKDAFLDLSSGDALSSSGSGMMGGLGGLGGEGFMDGFSQAMTDPAYIASLEQSFRTNAAGYRPPTFKPIPGKRGKARKLEGDSIFAKVFTPHDPQAREEGRGYIYFFPNGTAEHAFVQLSDGENRIYTVEIHPLSGKSFFYAEEIEPEEGLDELQEASE